jgi:hypothetical protein
MLLAEDIGGRGRFGTGRIAVVGVAGAASVAGCIDHNRGHRREVVGRAGNHRLVAGRTAGRRELAARRIVVQQGPHSHPLVAGKETVAEGMENGLVGGSHLAEDILRKAAGCIGRRGRTL